MTLSVFHALACGQACAFRRAVAPASRLAAMLAATVMVSATSVAHEATKGGITAAHPWTRATPGGATVGAAYLELRSDGVSDRLVAASSPAAGRVEIHTHIHEGGVMKMRRIDGIDVTPAKPVVLKPSGDHIMLMDLKAPLKEGDLVKLTLQFEKAGSVEIEATVEPVGAMGPHGMDHQPGHDPKTDASGHGHHGHHGGKK